MTTGLPLFPVHLVDFLGSSVMICLSVSALSYSYRLVRLESRSVIWTYLFWLSLAMVAFALSRGIGHVLRFILIFIGHPGLWQALSPVSGGLNTIVFVSITTLTFYYPNMRNVINRVRDDARRLEEAHAKLRELNLSLEQRVEGRTRELRISEEKYRRLFDNSKDAIFFCDAGRRIADINGSAVELLGYERKEDLIGKPILELFAEETNFQQFSQRLCSQGHIKDFEAAFLRSDGATISLIVTADSIHDEAGRVIGCEGIGKDISRFRHVMAQLMESEKMASVGQLAAGVAHEINTPLGIMLGYVQLLEEDFENNPEVYELLEIIEKQTKICKRIVADLLKFSRESVRGIMAPLDINSCIEDVLSVTEHSLNMDQIYVHRVFATNLPSVTGDAGKLQQVFLNILNNAHHAIEKEGIVGIWTRLSEDGGMVEILFGDTGTGVPAEIQRKIFDPFFTTKGVGKGTGLGLSVSYGIVREHGGTISVESPPTSEEFIKAGMQTLFIVRLPHSGNPAAGIVCHL